MPITVIRSFPQNNIYNDNIKKNIKYIFAALLVCIAIYLMYMIATSLNIIKNNNYQQDKIEYFFERLHGEEKDENAEEIIRLGNNLVNARPIDHYRVGATYLLNMDNKIQARDHFNTALRQIIQTTQENAEEQDVRDTLFIIERITDLRDYFIDIIEIDELPLQPAIFAHIELKNELMKEMPKIKKEIAADDPEFTQKTIINKIDWKTDSQNVHDKSMTDMLKMQYAQVLLENNSVKNGNESIDEIFEIIRSCVDERTQNKIDKFFTAIQHNVRIDILGSTEHEYVKTIWKRIHDGRNTDKYNDLRNSFVDSICDCVEVNKIVCLSGRCKKLWQTFAKMDFNENLGILKSKQMIRNEILEKVAHIVNSYIGENGRCSDEVKKMYNSDNKSPEIDNLIKLMTNDIRAVKVEYENIYDAVMIDLILNECIACL